MAAQAQKQKRVPPPLWQHFLAGTGGGVFGLSLAYPLDTVKVRMQTRGADVYRNPVHCLVSMVRSEGLGSLYRGLLSPVLGCGLINATAFGSYNAAKKVIRTNEWWSARQGHIPDAVNERDLTLGEMTAAGMAAGFVQSFVRTPIEQIKVVMQARNKPGTNKAPYRSTLSAYADVIRTEGIRLGLYRCLVPTLWREIPQYMIYYPSYELCKRYLADGQHVDDLAPSRMVLAGGIAGTAQWVPTYWIDVVKSRIHAAPPGTYRGFLHCTVTAYRQEGLFVFHRGLSAALVRAFPLHGAIFLGYEMTMRLLRPSDPAPAPSPAAQQQQTPATATKKAAQ